MLARVFAKLERLTTMSLEEKLRLDKKVEIVIGWASLIALVMLLLLTLYSNRMFPMSTDPPAVASSTTSYSQSQQNDALIMRNTEQLASVQAQMNDMQRQLDKIDRMDLQTRMTRLESYSESNRQILVGIALAMATMLLEAAHRLLKPRRKSED